MNKEELRNISREDLARLGAPFEVYIRPLADETGAVQYVIHAANGAPLGAISSHAGAVEAAQENNLRPVTVH